MPTQRPTIAPSVGLPKIQPMRAPAPVVTPPVARSTAPAPAGSKLWRGSGSIRGGAYHGFALVRDTSKWLRYAENGRILPEFVQCRRVSLAGDRERGRAATSARPRQRLERLGGLVGAGAA